MYIRLADALAKYVRRLGIGEVARAEELAHTYTFAVAGLERLRSDAGDVTGRNHRDGEVWRD